MALLHHATPTPSKADLLSGWLPGRPWAAGAALPPGETLTARWEGGGPAVLATVPRSTAGA